MISVGTAIIAAQAEILRMSSLSASEVRASDACRIEDSSSSRAADLVADPDGVVQDVAEVGAHRLGDAVDLPLGQLLQRHLQRGDRPAQLHQLALELVEPADVVGAARG